MDTCNMHGPTVSADIDPGHAPSHMHGLPWVSSSNSIRLSLIKTVPAHVRPFAAMAAVQGSWGSMLPVPTQYPLLRKKKKKKTTCGRSPFLHRPGGVGHQGRHLPLLCRIFRGLSYRHA